MTRDDLAKLLRRAKAAAPMPGSVAAQLAGEAPDGLTAEEWTGLVWIGAQAIADAQSVENEGTPEEYAAAALRRVAQLAATKDTSAALPGEAGTCPVCNRRIGLTRGRLARHRTEPGWAGSWCTGRWPSESGGTR